MGLFYFNYESRKARYYLWNENIFFSLDINDCAPNPCRNGGTCKDELKSYVCHCRFGYIGDNCEISNDLNDSTWSKSFEAKSEMLMQSNFIKLFVNSF